MVRFVNEAKDRRKLAAVSIFLTICAAGSRHADDYLTVWLWTAPWRVIYEGFPRSTRSSPMPLIGVETHRLG
jgi:hypothetical protein